MATFPYKESKNATYDSNVAAVQRDLNALRPKAEEKFQMSVWGDLSTDGCYGPKTAAVVKTFQSLYGLSSDGVFGPATQSALRSALRDEKVKANSKPVSASINETPSTCSSRVDANYTPSCDNNLITEPAPPPVIPSCAQNYSPVVPASQQDDFMCSTQVTVEQVVDIPATSTNSNYFVSDFADKFNKLFSPATAGLNSATSYLSAQHVKFYNNIYSNSQTTVSSDFLSRFVSAYKENKLTTQQLADSISLDIAKRKFTLELNNPNTVVASQLIAQQKLKEITDKEAKKHLKETGEIARRIVQEEYKNGQPDLQRMIESLNKCSRIKSIVKFGGTASNILNFTKAGELLYDNRPFSDVTWREEFKKAFFEGLDALLIGLLVSFIGDLIKAGLTALGVKAWIITTIVLVIVAVIGALAAGIYSLIKKEEDPPFTLVVYNFLTNINPEDLHEAFVYVQNDKANGW